jgi:hypothetical protein
MYWMLIHPIHPLIHPPRFANVQSSLLQVFICSLERPFIAAITVTAVIPEYIVFIPSGPAGGCGGRGSGGCRRDHWQTRNKPAAGAGRLGHPDSRSSEGMSVKHDSRVSIYQTPGGGWHARRRWRTKVPGYNSGPLILYERRPARIIYQGC